MGQDQFAKGGNPYLLPLAKGGREGFYKDFQTAKVLRIINFQAGRLKILGYDYRS
jgi:hypothetical protein